jgi:hypothetical protein
VGRRTVVVELSPEGTVPSVGSRQDRLEAVRHSTADVKQRVIKKLEGLRSLDPVLRIESGETIFPVLIVTATDEVLAKISDDPDVRSLAPATDFRIPSKSPT